MNFRAMYIETLRDNISNDRNLITSLMSGVIDRHVNGHEIDRLTTEVNRKLYEVEDLLRKIDSLLIEQIIDNQK